MNSQKAWLVVTKKSNLSIIDLSSQTFEDVEFIGYKWVFTWKHDEYAKVTRYTVCVKFPIHNWLFEYIFSNNEYHYVLICNQFGIFIKTINIYLVNIVTIYLFAPLDTYIYLRIPERFKVPEVYKSSNYSFYLIKL